jgi:DNA-directed RNA polymerase subunit H (RpoH/RPB5)
MASLNNYILKIYKSKTTLIEQLKGLEYDVSSYDNFSINEIDAMIENEQMDMLVSREDGKKIYVKYLMTKTIRKETVDQIIEDLFEIEHILEKKDTLVIVSLDDPNDTITEKIRYEFDSSGIHIIIRSLNRIQFNILNHTLVPPATILNETEIQELKRQYNLEDLSRLQEISRFDQQALCMCLRPGQVIKINRNSDTALEYINYRVCV